MQNQQQQQQIEQETPQPQQISQIEGQQQQKQRKLQHQKLCPRQILRNNKDLILDIVDHGFCDLVKIIQVINKCNGSIEKIQKMIDIKKDKMQKKAQRFQEKQEKLKQTPKLTPLELYQDQFITLVKKGVSKNVKLIIKALVKNDGNIEKAEEFLKVKEAKVILKNRKKDNFQYKDQIKTLIQEGFDTPFLIIKGLQINNGDIEKTKEFIKNSLEKRQKGQKDKSDAPWIKNQKNKEKFQKPKVDDELVELLKDLKLENWDDKIQTLFIDANNLFFVNPEIRNMIIKDRKSGQKQAELLLTELFRKFSQSKKPQGLKNVRIIFDNTPLKVNENDFIVESAAPKYSTSDDYLVDICSQIQEESVKNTSLFVTSDQGLIRRLIEKGAKHFMKSGKFLSEVESSLTTEQFQKIIKQQ